MRETALLPRDQLQISNSKEVANPSEVPGDYSSNVRREDAQAWSTLCVRLPTDVGFQLIHPMS